MKTQSRNVRSRDSCSMCPAIHTNSRSWLRSSSTHEPSDPPPRVAVSFFVKCPACFSYRGPPLIWPIGFLSFFFCSRRSRRGRKQRRTPLVSRVVSFKGCHRFSVRVKTNAPRLSVFWLSFFVRSSSLSCPGGRLLPSLLPSSFQKKQLNGGSRGNPRNTDALNSPRYDWNASAPG